MRALVIAIVAGLLAACGSSPGDGCRSAPPVMPNPCQSGTQLGIGCLDNTMMPICRDGITTPGDPENPSEAGQENCIQCSNGPSPFPDGCYFSGAGYCVHDCSKC
jgi:hypothetical protein